MFDFLKTKKTKCTCGIEKRSVQGARTSQEVEARYNAIVKCPVHSKIPKQATKRYEVLRGKTIEWKKQKGAIFIPAYAVMQAVGLKQVGIKAFFTPSLFKAVSVFPTQEDARAYLLEVIDTVKREQRMGIRTKRNLDPKFEGGLDFQIMRYSFS